MKYSLLIAALLIILAVSSSWTIQPTITRQVGKEHSVIRLGLPKPSRKVFQQRGNMYLRISSNVFPVHQRTSYRMLHEVCCFSGRGWILTSQELLPLEDKEAQRIDLCSLYVKVSEVLWYRRYVGDAIV